jgi:hypothetical protein
MMMKTVMKTADPNDLELLAASFADIAVLIVLKMLFDEIYGSTFGRKRGSEYCLGNRRYSGRVHGCGAGFEVLTAGGNASK